MHMQKLNVRSQPGIQGQVPGPLGGMPVQSQGMAISGPPRSGMVSPAQTALQQLQEEKEKLRKRQEELNRQVGCTQVNISILPFSFHGTCTHAGPTDITRQTCLCT